VAASLLSVLSLPELVAGSLADYEARALAFVRAPSSLAAIRAKLVQNQENSPLYQPRRFCRQLEAGFAAMWERRQRGEAPADIAVARISGLN
jgi:predicted O-linked N-acetylglucosamine transferase (SPINDLY family)